MNNLVIRKTYSEPPFCEKEILRYAGCSASDREITALLESSAEEARKVLDYKVCYKELPVSVAGEICVFSEFSVQSQRLAANLKECESVILFAATVGHGIDRLIAKYGRISPTRALMLGAIGAERIEALCDAFCQDISNEKIITLKPRFSPGYGDLPLSAQKDIFNTLDCSKHIGLFLSDSLIMTPSKSVTAFAGVGGEKTQTVNKCSYCDKINCTFRGAL